MYVNLKKRKGESAVHIRAMLSREGHNLITFLPCEQLVQGEINQS